MMNVAIGESRTNVFHIENRKAFLNRAYKKLSSAQNLGEAKELQHKLDSGFRAKVAGCWTCFYVCCCRGYY